MPQPLLHDAVQHTPRGQRIAPSPVRAGLPLALACLLLLASLFTTVHPAHAAELDPQRQALIASMYQPDAVLTEQVHRDFWAGFSNDPNDPNLPGAMARMAAALKSSLDFERAKVLSYQLSIARRKPAVDASYEQALQARLELLRARNRAPDTILAQDKEFRDSLVPVSRGKPMGSSSTSSGAKLVMTTALLDQLLKNIEATHKRLERLLAPVWVPPPPRAVE